MKKTLSLILALLLTTVAGATVWTPTSIPIAHLEDMNRYVCNPDGILSQAAVSEIDALMRTVEDSTGVQSIIAVVSEIDPNDCFEFALELGEKNGIGTKEKNDGLVLLLCTGERCVQICTGYGVEGSLTDAVCRRIQEQYMNPHFAVGDWDKGMTEGARVIKETLLKEEGGLQSHADGGSVGSAILLLLFLPIILTAYVFTKLSKRKKCPECGKHKLKKMSRTLLSDTDTMKTYSALWECQNCHHTLHRVETEYKASGISGNGGAGGLGGTVTRSGGLGGGSIGGHYGGGHFGGGGAGSRF